MCRAFGKGASETDKEALKSIEAIFLSTKIIAQALEGDYIDLSDPFQQSIFGGKLTPWLINRPRSPELTRAWLGELNYINVRMADVINKPIESFMSEKHYEFGKVPPGLKNMFDPNFKSEILKQLGGSNSSSPIKSPSALNRNLFA